MVALLLCSAALLVAALLAVNRLTPRIHVADGETLALGADSPACALDGAWARTQDGSEVTYSLSFSCPDDAELALYLSSSSSRLLVNGREVASGGRSFLVVPLASSRSTTSPPPPCASIRPPTTSTWAAFPP